MRTKRSAKFNDVVLGILRPLFSLSAFIKNGSWKQPKSLFVIGVLVTGGIFAIAPVQALLVSGAGVCPSGATTAPGTTSQCIYTTSPISASGTVTTLITCSTGYGLAGPGVCAPKSNGLTWTATTLPINNVATVSSANGYYFIQSSGGGVVYKSTDGITWSTITAPSTVSLTSFVYIAGKYVSCEAGSGSARCFYSSDLITWTATTPDTSTNLGTELLTSGNYLIRDGQNFVTPNTNLYYDLSIDGVNWTKYNVPLTNSSGNYNWACGGGNCVYMSYSNTSNLYVTRNGSTFTTKTSPSPMGRNYYNAALDLFEINALSSGTPQYSAVTDSFSARSGYSNSSTNSVYSVVSNGTTYCARDAAEFLICSSGVFISQPSNFQSWASNGSGFIDLVSYGTQNAYYSNATGSNGTPVIGYTGGTCPAYYLFSNTAGNCYAIPFSPTDGSGLTYYCTTSYPDGTTSKDTLTYDGTFTDTNNISRSCSTTPPTGWVAVDATIFNCTSITYDQNDTAISYDFTSPTDVSSSGSSSSTSCYAIQNATGDITDNSEALTMATPYATADSCDAQLNSGAIDLLGWTTCKNG
jgi:hypothetical protein